MQTVAQILKGLNAELKGELPILGFAGSPMSLAFFLIAGSSPNRKIKEVLAFVEEQPAITEALLELLTEMTVDYLNFQIASGADAVQLFESFADVIPLEIYKKFVQPTHEKIFSSLIAKCTLHFVHQRITAPGFDASKWCFSFECWKLY